MSSIPYKLKIDAKNILKFTFHDISKKLLGDVLDEHFDFFNPTKYINSTINLMDKFKEVIIKTLEKSIPKIDELFLNSRYRKFYFYKSNVQKRSITTIFGDLNFERIYYTNKDKQNGFYFIDELFGFEKYTTYDPIVRALLIDSSVTTNANLSSSKTSLILNNYKDYMDKNYFKNISRQTIYNWEKEWNVPKVEYPYYEGNKKLYVMVDEKWIHEQIRLSLLNDEEKKKHHYIMTKCFVAFTGAITKNKRTKLLNRHVFMTTSDKPWKEFIDEIYNIYNFEEIEEIYLLSDAGTWILAGKDELKLNKNNKVIVNICEFHVKEYINRLVRSQDKRDELIKAIYDEKDKNKFTELVNQIINNVTDEKKKEKKEKYKNYVLNHWEGILNMKDREIRSSMESHISHCVAATFGSRPKGYSKKLIQKYIKLEEYKQNGINIMDLYLCSYNLNDNIDFVYNQKEVSLSSFERKTSSNIPVKSTTNPIGNLLGKIAYGY